MIEKKYLYEQQMLQFHGVAYYFLRKPRCQGWRSDLATAAGTELQKLTISSTNFNSKRMNDKEALVISQL